MCVSVSGGWLESVQICMFPSRQYMVLLTAFLSIMNSLSKGSLSRVSLMMGNWDKARVDPSPDFN